MWLAFRVGITGRIIHFRNTCDGKSSTILRRLQDRVKLLLARKYATGVLAVCRGAMEAGWGTDWRDDHRARVIYNGLDMAPFANSVERESVLVKFGIPSQSYVFIHVGHMYPQKDHELLINSAIQVIKQKASVHLLLVGDGVLRGEIEEQIRRNKVAGHVHLAGMREDIPRLLKASDCFVLSSRWEGLPGVVLEAIAAGLPVIATDLPGVREIAEYTDLITMVPVGNSDVLAEMMLEKCEKSELHQEAKEFPDAFKLELCADTLYDFYRKQLA